MARDTADATPLTHKSQLADYLAAGCKPKAEWRIGTEHEKFAFYRDGNRPVPYEGDAGIRALLEGMQTKLGWEPIMDGGNIIGLGGPTGEGAISLEPGGQFELSGAPLETIHQTCRESNAHLSQLRAIADPMGIGFLGMGGSPKWTLSETPVMPKSRYKIMANYMPEVGRHGLDMMFRTCTIQVNLDFSDESDMRRKLQVSTRMQALATALFASSPFTDGKPNGHLSWRGLIWTDVDNNRSGVPAIMLDPGFGFEAYVEWALDVPMYFILRDGHYHRATHVTFRQFMDGALKDEIPDPEPTMGDWTNHLSTLFPDVRLKRFLEMRGADGGPWRRICALPALWVGLLYDDAALASAEALVADWSHAMVLQLRRDVPDLGLKAEIGGRDVRSICRDVLAISRDGLKARNRTNADGYDETHFLSPLEEIVARGTTAAEVKLDAYHLRWDRSVEPIFEEFAF